MKKIILILLAALVLSGCASFYASRYPGNNYAPTIAANIPIYNNFPPQSYEVIGEVGGGGAPMSSWAGMGKRIREEAAKMGGDAIVIQQVDTPYVGTYNTPSTSTTNSSAYGSVYGNRNYATGQVYGQSQTTYYPGSSIPMYGKSVKAVVIKFKTAASTASTPSNSLEGGERGLDSYYVQKRFTQEQIESYTQKGATRFDIKKDAFVDKNGEVVGK